MKNDTDREAAKHQPSAAEMRKKINLDATLNQLGASVMRGGAARKSSNVKEQDDGRTS